MKMVINREGQLDESGIVLVWKKFLRWRWIWSIPQTILLVAQFCIIPYKHHFGGLYRWISWSMIIIQWTLLYFQLRSCPRCGFEIVAAESVFGKWDLLNLGGARIVGLVYKIKERPDELISVWIYPFRASRRRALFNVKIWGIRLLLLIRLIN